MAVIKYHDILHVDILMVVSLVFSICYYTFLNPYARYPAFYYTSPMPKTLLIMVRSGYRTPQNTPSRLCFHTFLHLPIRLYLRAHDG